MSQELRQKITQHERELRRLRKQLRKSKGLGPKKKGQGCRDRDEALKAARGYKHPSTRVRRDGSEKLVGDDWLNRVVELAYRSGDICEWTYEADGSPSFRCVNRAVDPHHKIKRSVRRDDRLSNLMHLCRIHHDALDPRKTRFTKRTFAVKPAPESEPQPT